MNKFHSASRKGLMRGQREHRRGNIVKVLGTSMPGPDGPNVLPPVLGSQHFVRPYHDGTSTHAKAHFGRHNAGEALSGGDEKIDELLCNSPVVFRIAMIAEPLGIPLLCEAGIHFRARGR